MVVGQDEHAARTPRPSHAIQDAHDDPEEALPDPAELASPDKLIAMSTRLAEIGAHRCQRGTDQQKRAAPLKLLRSLAWVTRDNHEYCGAGISTYAAGGGDVAGVLRAARKHKGDPVIGGLLGHLKSAIREVA